MQRRQCPEMESKYSIERFREGGGGAGIEAEFAPEDRLELARTRAAEGSSNLQSAASGRFRPCHGN